MNNSSLSINLIKNLLYVLIAILVLNPYTIFGNFGSIIGLCIAVYTLVRHFHLVNYFSFVMSVLLMLIGFWGVYVSILNGIFQLNHFITSASILIYLLIGIFLKHQFNKVNYHFDDLVKMFLVSVFINSFVILIQVNYPEFRSFVESYLIPSGNIDWRVGLRYRGLASGGGASLSVLIPCAIVATFHLFNYKKIGIIFFIVSLVILIFSIFFIGRTGLILMVIPFLFFPFFISRQNFLKSIYKNFTIGMTLVLLTALTFNIIGSYIIENHGYGLYNYAIGFLIDGAEGISREGTVGRTTHEFNSLPSDLIEAIFGMGFYGGSQLDPWVDSGFVRTFMSVGYILGILYYAIIFLITIRAIPTAPYLLVTILSILLVAEVKEPLLTSGYSSRIFFIMIGFLINNVSCNKNLNSILILRRVTT